MRLRRSASADPGMLMRKGRMASVPAAGAGRVGSTVAVPAAVIPIAAVTRNCRRFRLALAAITRMLMMTLLAAGKECSKVVRARDHPGGNCLPATVDSIALIGDEVDIFSIHKFHSSG